MQTKDLLSQSEIDSLLDIFTSPAEEKNRDILFEVRMARAVKGIENYLENLGLQFDAARVSKSRAAEQNSCHYTPDCLYLENLSIENSLALSILAVRFGSKQENLLLERELTSLEKELLEDVCKEITYIVEKELDSYLLKDAAALKIEEYSLFVVQESVEHAISFSFTKESIVPTAPVVFEDEPVPETNDAAGTKIEAILGTIAAKTLEKDIFYNMQAFAENRAALLLDGTLPFMAKRLQEDEKELSFMLQEAASDKTVLEGYYLCVARATIDDEVLLALEHGTVLELKPYDDVQIHKDGKMVAKAKVFVLDGEIAVKVIDHGTI